MKSVKINTSCGEIIGIDNEDYTEFRGIKYANAGRWEYPVQVTKWDGVYDATFFKDCSYQKRAFEDDALCNAFYHNEFRRGLNFTYSENCQYLNIWAPKNAQNCSVMIYIHGGSFTGGSTDERHLDGKAFAKNDIIFVSMNYRLGPFGFCSHTDLSDENGVCGNFGIYDQYVAIKWVKDYISEFGGNPDKITLCGQSAGAMSVDIHLTNPMCKGWFAGAVLMSGAAFQRNMLKPVKPEKSTAFWQVIIENANVSNINELKMADAKTLFYAWEKACKKSMLNMLYTFPVYDGKIITENNFKMKNLPDISYMLGITSTDMVPMVLQGLTNEWSKKADKCYTYLLARNLPGDDRGAWHACDLLYAFNTLSTSWRPFDEVDYRISNEMLKSFVAFVKNGDPNCNAIPKWECKYNKAMIFCENTRFAKLPTARLIKNTFTHGGFI